MQSVGTLFSLIQETIKQWNQDNVPLFAASLAFYTAFALAPLIVLVLGLVGLVANTEVIQTQIIEQISSAIGRGAAEVVGDLIDHLGKQNRSIGSSIISVSAMLLGTLAVFNNLQVALNRIWGVDDMEPENGIRQFIVRRLLSFGMMLVVGFLLVVSLVASTTLTFVDRYLLDLLPNIEFFLRLFSQAISFGITALLFALVYKFLPNADVRWRDVWVGAVVTALLFTIGRTILGWYLGNSVMGSAYGAAGAFGLVLLWVYYSALIVLFGAEFTHVFAGSRITASKRSIG